MTAKRLSLRHRRRRLQREENRKRDPRPLFEQLDEEIDYPEEEYLEFNVPETPAAMFEDDLESSDATSIKEVLPLSVLDDFFEGLFVREDFLNQLRDESSESFATLRDFVVKIVAFNSAVAALDAQVKDKIDEASEVITAKTMQDLEDVSEVMLLSMFISMLSHSFPEHFNGDTCRMLQERVIRRSESAVATKAKASKAQPQGDPAEWLKALYEQSKRRGAQRETKTPTQTAMLRRNPFKHSGTRNFSLMKETNE